MKKLLLLCLFITGFSISQSSAQFCIPDKTLVDSVVGLGVLFPAPYDTMTMMGGFEDTTCIGVYYETDLNIVIPESVPLNGASLPLFNIKITGVTNLPAGMNYACTPAPAIANNPCIFTPLDTVACIQIYGIPEDTVTAKNYRLGITGTANVGFDVDLSILLDANGGGYFLYVRDLAEVMCSGVATENLLSNAMRISNNPNPFSDYTTIDIDSEVSGDFNFQVVNMLGAIEHHEKVNITNGKNQVPFDGSSLSEGIYFYTISNELGQLSGKMMINR